MKTIVEVGAFEGYETFKFAHQNPDSQVYAFEPDASNFRKLNTQSRHFKNVTVLPFAVDIGDNQEPLFDHPDGQSTLQPPWGEPQARFRMVWTMRLETFIHLYSIEQIDLLHIDAPFREEMILESLGFLVDRVVGGRVTLYDPEHFDMAFLVDHGYSIERHQPHGPANPELTFWR